MEIENIKIIDGINDNNKSDIVKWTNEKGRNFLEQWAGKSLDFPLMESQIDDLKNIHIGRFLINPELTGKGLGKRALLEFINLIFQEKNVNSITLNVFDYNVGAKKLYEKVGFKVVNIAKNPMKKYMMVMEKGEK